MRGTAVLIALILVMTIPMTQVGAKSDAMMGEDLFVEWDPHILTLAPGEEDDVTITVHGDREASTMVGIRWNYIESPGASVGDVTPDYFLLGSHDEVDVTVHVRSRAVRSADECASDVYLTFFWGPNLTRTGDNIFDRDTAVGWEDLQIHVTDEFGTAGEWDGINGLLLLMVIVLSVAIVLLVVRTRRTGP